ncbi:uncharacterized protein LOC135847265 [Planococcus citri]|uniref:uncharacterized protein LOC135847265 n=1 Tax=Planococcus citri TaxID=170843 RepID=UPI0031FA3808
MIKASLFFCAIFVLVQYGNSSPDEFGSFWGPCPAKPSVNISSSVSYKQITGKWYIHQVLGQYSPWKAFECQNNNVLYKRKEKTANVTSRFVVPGVELPVEWNGTLSAVNSSIGKFEAYYITNDGWLFLENSQILQYYRKGAALAWTCLEFGFFHIESISVMTKYQDPNDTRIPPFIYTNMYDSLQKAGVSPTWFELIPQDNCDNRSFSVFQAVSVAKNLQSFVPAKYLKKLNAIFA